MEHIKPECRGNEGNWKAEFADIFKFTLSLGDLGSCRNDGTVTPNPSDEMRETYSPVQSTLNINLHNILKAGYSTPSVQTCSTDDMLHSRSGEIHSPARSGESFCLPVASSLLHQIKLIPLDSDNGQSLSGVSVSQQSLILDSFFWNRKPSLSFVLKGMNKIARPSQSAQLDSEERKYSLKAYCGKGSRSKINKIKLKRASPGLFGKSSDRFQGRSICPEHLVDSSREKSIPQDLCSHMRSSVTLKINNVQHCLVDRKKSSETHSIDGDTDYKRQSDESSQPRRCRCQKSQCKNNYCGCFINGKKCLESCRCFDCTN